MDTNQIMMQIRKVDSEVKGLDSLVENMTKQSKGKKQLLMQLRAELKAAFAVERGGEIPAAKHQDIYV